MYIVRFRGGLGNQMFQYAFCEYLSKKGAQVYIDKTEYDAVQVHCGYEINKCFYQRFMFAKRRDIIRLSNYIPVPIGGIIGAKFLSLSLIRESKMALNGKRTVVDESQLCQGRKEIDDLIRNNSDLYFKGYWNKECYISAIETDKLFEYNSEFRNKYKAYVNELKKKDTCSIHIRRGDYKNTSYVQLGKEYYYSAISYVESIKGKQRYYVFSDDINDAKNTLGTKYDFVYIDTKKEKTAGLDMFLMSCCENNIIANSTYSFWGAELNRNANKVVVAPKEYDTQRGFNIARPDWVLL